MATDERPDSPAVADAAAGLTAAYVHIPFCRRVCPYCDFAVIEGQGDLVARYVAAVLAEIDAEAPLDAPLASVFVGGGTPTAVPARHLGEMVRRLADRLGLAAGAEVSVEANPEDVTPALAEELASYGFTRMSLGVQSFDPRVLAYLGRGHSPEQAAAGVATALDVFPSVNVDLMFGSPGESVASWRRSVDTALDSGTHHLSVYALTVERGTPLSRRVAGGAPAPDPDDQAAKYEIAVAAAESAGLIRYETSNMARHGHACVYNLVTWAQGEYCAFGNGAHRHRSGRRSWNVARVDRYIERIEAGELAVSGEETLDPWGREVERALLGIRRASGVSVGVVGRRLLESEAGRRLASAGVVVERDGRLVVARPLLGDEVARSLLAVGPSDC